jgi:hypothetical protein
MTPEEKKRARFWKWMDEKTDKVMLTSTEVLLEALAVLMIVIVLNPLFSFILKLDPGDLEEICVIVVFGFLGGWFILAGIPSLVVIKYEGLSRENISRLPEVVIPKTRQLGLDFPFFAPLLEEKIKEAETNDDGTELIEWLNWLNLWKIYQDYLPAGTYSMLNWR